MSAAEAPTSFGVPVHMELPQRHYRHLDVLATRHRTTVASLVRECVRRQIELEQANSSQEQAKGGRRNVYVQLDAEHVPTFRALHAEGLNDMQIALRLGSSNAGARKMRIALGLPGKPPGRPPTTTDYSEEAS